MYRNRSNHEYAEEETVAALHTLFTKVEALRQIEIRGILLPDIYLLHERTLQEAYDALTSVEDALTKLGMKLEYQHYRLGGALHELTLPMAHPVSEQIE